jgi:hypothetical protein
MDLQAGTPQSQDGAASGGHGTAGGPIKKATSSGICHAPGTPGYSSTKKFTKYPTLEACLASGGRLPKQPGH